MLHPDTPAKCCSYCGGRDHDFEECPKRKADAEKEEAARVARFEPSLASGALWQPVANASDRRPLPAGVDFPAPARRIEVRRTFKVSCLGGFGDLKF